MTVEATISTVRTQILDAILSSLRTIRKGKPVFPSLPAGIAYSTTVGKVYEAEVNPEGLPDSHFPLIVVDDTHDATRFAPFAEGTSYQAVWGLTLWLVVKDGRKRELGQSVHRRALYAFWRDVGLALHRGDGSGIGIKGDPAICGRADVSLDIEGMTVHAATKPEFGLATVDVAITYIETMR